MRWFWIIAIFFLDRFSKLWALQQPHPCNWIPGVNVVVVHNHGITFGLMQHIPVALYLLVVCIMITYVGYWMHRSRHPGFALILGGALGNLYDRWLFGYVVDFIDLYVYRLHYPWVFNIADVCILAGIGWILLKPASR